MVLEAGTGIADLVWVLFFSTLAGLLSVRFKIPPVAGLLVAGLLIGPNVLNLVHPSTINTFADIGAVLLLFMIGVEFSIAKLLSTGLRAMISSLISVLLTFLVMHEITILLGFDPVTSLYLSAMFSMSSTAIMMKILEQKRFIERQEVPTLVTILIIEDVIAVFMLTFFSSFKGSTAAALTANSVVASVVIALGVLGFTYVILMKLLRRVSDVFLRYATDDTLIFFSTVLGIGMSVLASLLGLTPSIGAFLAGSLIAGLPNGRAFETAMRPFSIVFSSFFFLSIGMLIAPSSLLVSADVTFLLIGAFIVTVFLVMVFTFFLLSTNGRSAIFAGIAMVPLGEFSLLIAKEGVGVVQTDLVGIASLGVLITSLVCSFGLNYQDKLYRLLKPRLSSGFRDTLSAASCYFINVVSAFERHGYFNRILKSESEKILLGVLYVLGAALFLLFARIYLSFQVFIPVANITVGADVLAFALIVLFALVPLLRLLSSLKRLFDALAVIFSRSTSQASKGIIIRNLMISVVFLALFANSPFIVDFLVLPRAFNWFSILFAAISVFFLWSALRAASLGIFLRRDKMLSLFRQEVTPSGSDLLLVASSSGNSSDRSGTKKASGKRRKIIFLR